jgi:amidase
MPDEFAQLDATSQADLIRQGEIAPITLVDAAIACIERLNPQLNAVITPLFEQARTQALSPHLPQGPFRGVPLLLKDFLCQTAGDPYYEGMRFLRDLGWRSTHETYLAAKLRTAGFVFLGKTNVPELASGPVTDSVAFGPARNPFDTTRTAGGSSGGSAAAVAAGMVAVAHGNDGTGSLRIPASCCGLVGLKPSRGRISLGPAHSGGLFGNICEHVLTRSVRDAAAILDVVAGPMPGDLFIAPPPRRSYREEVGTPPDTLRIGLLMHDPLLKGLQEVQSPVPDVYPECVAAVQETGRVLESFGHSVEESYPSALDGPTGLGPRYLGVISASATAATLDAWSARTGRTIGPEDVEPRTRARAEAGRTYTAAQIHVASQRLVTGVCRVPEWWAAGFDVLVTPTMAQVPPKLSECAAAGTHWAGIFGLFTMPYSFTGQPAISLPLHWSREGLPIGVQLIADYGREDVLFQVAAQLEAARPWVEHYPTL